MKCKMSWVWSLILALWGMSVPVEAQKTQDISPDARKMAKTGLRLASPAIQASSLVNTPILYSFYTSVGGTPAIESDGKYFYSTAWRGVSGYDNGTFWLYDTQGKEVSRVIVANGGNVRDLTTDGRYFYGGQFRTSSERDILKMDIKTGTLIERIPVVMKTKLEEVRHCTYDPGLDGGKGGFWIGGWSEMAAVSMAGQELISNISGATADCYGVGLDRITDPARPRLLMFRQTGSNIEIHGFDIMTQKPTGLVRDMSTSVPSGVKSGTAGGLTTYEENGKLIVLGNIQNDSKNYVFAFELATIKMDVPAMPEDLTVKSLGNNKAELRWTNPSATRDGRSLSGSLKIVVRRNGTVVQTFSNVTPGAPMKWTESGVSGTNFTYAVHAENQVGASEPVYVTGYKAVNVWGEEGWYDKTWYATNTGTSNAVVKTAAQLAAFAKRVNEGRSFEGCTVTLSPTSGNEISLAGAEWVPVGKSGSGFAGTFDGVNNRITGLTISDQVDYPYVGLFGKVTGTVKNVSLSGSINALTVSGIDVNVGAIAGYCSGTVEMCVSRASVKMMGLDNAANTTRIGGLIGYLDGGVLRYGFAIGDVEANGLTVDAGGVVGRLSGATSQLMYTYYVGQLRSSQNYRQGGVVGNKEGGTVKRCYFNKDKYTYGGLGKSGSVAVDLQEQAEGKITSYMKGEMVSDLNYARQMWIKDITNVNDGYPLLGWQDVTVPQITTLAATKISTTGATLNAGLKVGTMPITGQGFEWKESTALSYTQVTATLSSGNVTKSISGLTKGKKYVFRAYATTLVEGVTRYNYGDELNFATVSPLASGIRCVKPTATGKGDGTSWDNASSDLQGMINASGVTEVWVAAGCYVPDSKNRSVSFTIPNGKKIYGGFQGTESSVDERDLYVNRTVFSGDIGIPNDNSDNTYHVVQMSGGMLDGVTVTGGNANASFSPGWDGGGVYMSGSSELHNCIIINNQGGVGGGVFLNSSAKIYNCLITNNRAVKNSSNILGAGLHFESGGYAYYCTITNNMGAGNYGGISRKGGNLIGCVVWNNYPSQINAFGFGTWTQQYCAVEGESPNGTNISLKTGNDVVGGPNFVDPTVYNYYLTMDSPLSQSGEPVGTTGRQAKDIFGIAYPSSGRLSIGAFCGNGTTLKRQKALVTVESKTYAYEKGKPKNVTVTTNPANLNYVVEYRDRSGMSVGTPENVGTYDVTAVVNEVGYEGQGTGVLKIVETEPKAQQIVWEQSNTELEVGALAMKLEAYTDATGLKVSYYSENQNIVRVEQKGEDWYAFALTTTGEAVICAYQNGNEIYKAATSVKKKFMAVAITNPQLPIPDVTTCQVSGITGIDAVLNGLVVPGSLNVGNCGFEWKKESETSYVQVASLLVDNQISTPLKGLLPGEYYVCRAYATVVQNGVTKTVYGATFKFRTLVVPTVTVMNGNVVVGVYTTWEEACQAIENSSLTDVFIMTIDGEMEENGSTPVKRTIITGDRLKLSSGKVIAKAAVTYRNIELVGNEVEFFACGNELTIGENVVFALQASYAIYGGKEEAGEVEESKLTIRSGNWKKMIAGGKGIDRSVKTARLEICGGSVEEVDAEALQSSMLIVSGNPLIQTLKKVHKFRLQDDLTLEKDIEFCDASTLEPELRIRKGKKLMVKGASSGVAKVTIVYDTDEMALLTKEDNGMVVIVDKAAAENAFLLTNELKQLKKNPSTGEYTIEDVTALSIMQLATRNTGNFTLKLTASETVPVKIDNSRHPVEVNVTETGGDWRVDMSGAGDGVVNLVVPTESAGKITHIALENSEATGLNVKYASGLTELDIRKSNLNTLVLPDAKDELSSLTLDDCGLIALENIGTYSALKKLSIRDNKMTFATLPEKPVGAVDVNAFVYAPQDTVLVIPSKVTKNEQVDLKAQQRTVGNKQTIYTWKTRTTGKTLTAGVDYVESAGTFKFNPIQDSIYCEITHPAWPGLILRTSSTYVIDPSKEEQNIVFNDLGSVNLSVALLSLNATSSVGLPVSFVSFDEDVAVVSGNVLSLRKAGEVRIMAVQPGNDLVNAASPVVRVLKIEPLSNDPGKLSQTITFDELEKVSQDKGILSLNASSSVGLEIQYVCSDESIVKIDGSKLLLLKPGTVMIAATQEGNEMVNPASPVIRELVVDPAPTASGKQDQSIDFAEVGRVSLNKGMISLSVVSSAGLPVDLICSNTDVASLYGNVLMLHKTGHVAVIATQTGNDGYNPAVAVNRYIEVVDGNSPGKQPQTLSFEELGTKKLSIGILPLGATSSLGLPVAYQSSDASIAEVAGNGLILHATGRVIIAATQSGNDTVAIASPVYRELVVEMDEEDPAKQNQTISFDLIDRVNQTTGILALTGTASSGLNLTYHSSNASVAEVVGDYLVLHSPGQVVIAASQSGDNAYNAATPVLKYLSVEEEIKTIGKKDQILVFNLDSPQNKSKEQIQLMAEASSGLPVRFISSDTKIASISGSTLSLLKAGEVWIIAVQDGNDEWNGALAETRFLKVEEASEDPGKQEQTIVFQLPESANLGRRTLQLTAKASSGLPILYVSDAPETASVSGSTLTLLKTGSVSIAAMQGGNDAWKAAETEIRSLTILADSTIKPEKQNQVITFDMPLTINQGVGSMQLKAEASSGLPLSYVSSNPEMATVSGSTLTPLQPGIVVITALQPGNDVWNIAEPVSHMLMIVADSTHKPTKQDQVITFDLPLSVSETVESVVLSATASSGLPISYVSGNSEMATILENKLTSLKPGIIVITALQPGNDQWNAAQSVTRKMIIEAYVKPEKQDQIITFDLPQSVVQATGSVELTAKTSSNLPVSYVSSNPEIAMITGNTLTLLKAGTIIVTALQKGDDNWNMAPSVSHSLVIEPNSQTISFDLSSPVKQEIGTLELFANATSGLPVAFSCNDETVASVSGNVLTLLKSGTVIITALQQGNNDWLPASSVTRELTIEKNNQTITFSLASPVKRSIKKLELVANATSGLPVAFISSDESVVSISGTTLSLLSSGSVTIIAFQKGNDRWSAAEPILCELVIERDDQSIVFDLVPSVQLKEKVLELVASTTSGLPVTFSSSDETIASVSGTTLTLLKAGEVTITASQTGNGGWGTATSVSRELAIEKSSQTILFSLVSPVKQGVGHVVLSANATSDLPVTFTSSDETIASVSGTTLTLLKAGKVTITASQLGNSNWSAAPAVSQELVIEKNDQTITFSLSSPVKLNTQTLDLSANAVSGLPVTFTSSDETIASVTGTTLTLLKVGKVTIMASQVGNDNWLAAPSVSQELVIEKNDQTIAFVLSSPVKLGVQTVELSANAVSGLPVTFTSSDETIASVSGSTLTLLKVGKVTITASQSGNADWLAAPSVSQELVIEKNDQTIAFVLSSPVKLGAQTVELSANATSGLPVTFASSDETIASVSGTTLTLLKAGKVMITASQSGNADWSVAPSVGQELIIENNQQTISFTLASPVKQSIGSVKLSASATSGLPVAFASDDETIASVSGTTLTLLKAGKVIITASQPGNDNWLSAEPISQELVIEKNDQTITFSLSSPVKLSVQTVELSASATSSLPVIFTSDDETIASVSGKTLTLLKAGKVTITASQPGNDNWLSAEPISQELVIEKNDQTLEFTLVSPIKQGVHVVTLSANATSGLPVVFISSDETIASVSGATLTLVKAGKVTITASQSGNDNWLAAEPVSQELVIEKNDQTITFKLESPVKSGVGSVKLSANATSGLPVVFTSSDETIATVSGTTLTLLKIGSVTVTASQIGNENWNLAQAVDQILVIEKSTTITPPDSDKGSIIVKDDSGKEYGEDDVIPDGTEITMNPKPEEGYEFVEWNDGNTDNPRKVTTPVTGELTPIFKKVQQINFVALPSSVKQGVALLSLNAVATSGLPVVFRSSDENIASVSGNTLVLHAVGLVDIIASQVGDETWNKAPEQRQSIVIERSFTILATDQKEGELNIEDKNGKTYVAGNMIPDGTEVTVTVKPTDGWVFTQWSDGNVESVRELVFPLAEDLQVEFKHSQEIVFDLPEYVTLGDVDVISLDGTVESSLSVRYESSNPFVAEVRNNQELILLSPGKVVITANQDGDDTWMPAKEVVRTLVVLPRVPDMNVVNVVELRGDNNTKFLIKNFELYSAVKLKLMNIQGKVVYRSDNYDNNFDMRDFPRGVYYYVIDAVMVGGKHEVLKGGIEVMR